MGGHFLKRLRVRNYFLFGTGTSEIACRIRQGCTSEVHAPVPPPPTPQHLRASPRSRRSLVAVRVALASHLAVVTYIPACHLAAGSSLCSLLVSSDLACRNSSSSPFRRIASLPSTRSHRLAAVVSRSRRVPLPCLLDAFWLTHLLSAGRQQFREGGSRSLIAGLRRYFDVTSYSMQG